MKSFKLIFVCLILVVGLCQKANAQCPFVDSLAIIHSTYHDYVQANPSHGTAPYTYQWSTGDTSRTIPVYSNGWYCVTATDSTGCQVVSCDSVSMLNPPCPLDPTFIYSSNGGMFSFVDTSTHVVNTTSYQWIIDGVLVAAYASGYYNTLLPAGTHSVCLIVDNSYCRDSFCTNVVSTGCTFHDSMQVFYGTNNAYVIPHPYGGTAPYHYHWNTGSTNSTISTTVSGVYCVTVTDSLGCQVVSCDTVNVNACRLSGTISTQNNGQYAILTANASGAHGHVSFVWNGVSSSSNVATVTASGVYCVTLTDTAGCSAIICDTVGLTGCSLQGYIYPTQHGSFYSLSAHAYSTHPLYSYQWSNGSTIDSIHVTQSGVYCVTITDSAGCHITACDTVHIATNCAMTGYIGVQNNVTYAMLTANVSGAHGPVTYHWAGSSSRVLTVTGSGVYCVTVTDSTGCTITMCDTVHLNGCALAGYIFQTAHGTGYTLAAHVYSGSPPYTYLWSNGSVSDSIAVTSSGIYCVTISDTNGCYIYKCDTVHTACNMAGHIFTTGGSAYSILTANITGARGHITYRWSNTSSASNVMTVQASGVYCVTATDSAGCSLVLCDSVHVGCALYAYILDSARTGYHMLYAYPYNGTGPYTYHWSNGGSLGYIAAQSSGRYCVTITDHNGCTASACDSVIVNTAVPCHASFYSYDSCNGNVHFYNTSSGSGLLYTWRFGDGNTSASLNVVHHYASAGTYHVTLVVHGAGGCVDSITRNVVVHNVSCALSDTICGTVFYDANGNGVQDNGEHGIYHQHVYAGGYGTYTDSNGHYNVPMHSGLIYVYCYNNMSYSFTMPVGNGNNQGVGIYDSVHVSGGGHHCGYDFGMVDSNVHISGYVFLDANSNGIMDAGETGISHAMVYVGPHLVYTNSTGHFVYVGRAGSYSVSYVPSSMYLAYAVSPNSHSVSATSPGSVYAGNDFALSIATSACNIATRVIPHTTVTAGHPAWYYVYVLNYGTNTASGTMTFFYDPALTFASATPAQSSVNTSSHMVSFNYSGLLPSHYQVFYVYFDASTSVTVGQSTFEMATATDNCIETDLNDNTDTIHQTATGSWDPNDKIVTPSGSGSQGLIPADQELRYTINFQNTGTAPAVNVVLRDLLPTDLDVSTLKIIAASHPDHAIQIENGELVCRFSQIMLPDSFADPLGSQGFLSFSIKTNTGLAQGTQIQNTANIYFDYNTPVATNATLNTIDYKLSIGDIENHAVITVMPNPMTDYATISVSGINTANASLEIYNAIGQEAVASVSSVNGSFRLVRGSLAAGVYVYHIKQGDMLIGTGKLVIE